MINIFCRILRTLFGIYAIILFVCSLIVAFICYVIVFTLFSKSKAPFVAHRYISRPWARLAFILFFIRLDIRNKEILDRSKTYVFIANHRSQLDIPAYAVATDHVIRFLAKAELTKLPLMGFIIKRLYVSVERSDKTDRAKSMENMMQSLREGISVFICPEGTRNRTSDPLLPLRDGAFRLAIQAKVPLAILVILNADNLLSPLRPIELAPGKIICQWCEILETKGMTEEDIPALKERAVGIMLKHLFTKSTQ